MTKPGLTPLDGSRRVEKRTRRMRGLAPSGSPAGRRLRRAVHHTRWTPRERGPPWCVRRERPTGNARPRASSENELRHRGVVARAPKEPPETRLRNWRERIGAEPPPSSSRSGTSSPSAGARRHRSRTVGKNGVLLLLLLLLLLLMGRVVFLPTSPTRASRSAARPRATRRDRRRFDSSKNSVRTIRRHRFRVERRRAPVSVVSCASPRL